MPLTVKDILEKTFKKSFKGYDEDEVDKFLDQIIDEIKALQNDNASLKEALEAEKERAKRIRDTEETIMETLVSAQKSAKRIISEASNKAATIIDSAETTAKKRSEQTTKDLTDSQRRLDEVKKSAGDFAKSFTDMVSAQSAAFEKLYKNYFGDIEGGINLKALEKIDMDISQSLKDMPETVPEADEVPEASPGGQNSSEAFREVYAEAQAPETEETEPPKLMEFTEINKALSELEEGGEDILQDSYEHTQGDEDDVRTADKSSYDDYSWLYDRKDGEEDSEVTLKDPKQKAELESLIDDILE